MVIEGKPDPENSDQELGPYIHREQCVTDMALLGSKTAYLSPICIPSDL